MISPSSQPGKFYWFSLLLEKIAMANPGRDTALLRSHPRSKYASWLRCRPRTHSICHLAGSYLQRWPNMVWYDLASLRTWSSFQVRNPGSPNRATGQAAGGSLPDSTLFDGLGIGCISPSEGRCWKRYAGCSCGPASTSRRIHKAVRCAGGRRVVRQPSR